MANTGHRLVMGLSQLEHLMHEVVKLETKLNSQLKKMPNISKTQVTLFNREIKRMKDPLRYLLRTARSLRSERLPDDFLTEKELREGLDLLESFIEKLLIEIEEGRSDDKKETIISLRKSQLFSSQVIIKKYKDKLKSGTYYRYL